MMQRNAPSVTGGRRRSSQELIELLIPARLREDYRKAFRFDPGDARVPGPGKRMEMVAVRQDGEEIPIELNVSTFRLKDRWHAVGVMSDLSSRKWYEAQLEERARLSQTLAEIGGVLTREESIEAMLQGCTVRALEPAPGSRPNLGALIRKPGSRAESQCGPGRSLGSG